MTLYENEEVRAAAVQAAASILGGGAWYRRDVPGGGYEYLPSPVFKELTNRIGVYVTRGVWEGPSAGESEA